MTTSLIENAGRAVQSRRTDLGMSRVALARAANVDVKTVTAVETGATTPSPLTRAAIEKAIDWPTGTYNRLAAGVTAIPADDVAARGHAMRLAVEWTASADSMTTTHLCAIAAHIDRWIRTGESPAAS